MAVYKVIQDIEADDKLLGPLTLRQFVYAGVTVFCLYLSYFAISKGAAFLLVVFLPPAFIAGFFAFPWGKEQPTELWALARIRFLFKPRKRIWDQTGVKELVTVTAPKRIEKAYTDGLSQTEVRSRLQALATTIDSRGWAIKSAAMSPYMTTPVLAGAGNDGQRLIDPGTIAQDVPTDNTTIYDDVLDPMNNPKAQQFDSMLEHNAQAQRERLMMQMQQSSTDPIHDTPAQSTDSPYPDYWFLNEPAAQQTTPDGSTTFGSQAVTPDANSGTQTNNTPTAADEQVLIDQLRGQAEGQAMQYSHLPTILPISEQQKIVRSQQQTTPQTTDTTITTDMSVQNTVPSQTRDNQQVTPEPDAAILELAQKDDWNISTIARQAKKAHGEEPDEVVISLH